MRTFIHRFTVIFLGLWLLSSGNGLQAQQLRVKSNSQGVLVREGNRKVLFYQKAPKSYEGAHTRNHYIHPLYGLDGQVLTKDFPDDHRHQRGIFWAWHQMLVDGKAMGNMWLTRDFYWDVQHLNISSDSAQLTLNPVVYYRSSALKAADGNKIPFMKDSTRITVHKSTKNYQLIDFAIHLIPLLDHVALGGADNQKEYGGFSARIKLPEDMVFTSDQGTVIPRRTPVENSKWMDFSGTFNEQTGKSGLTILCHPDNPAFPPRWILRDAGSMQNPVFPGREPVAIKAPVVLRYRLVMHKRDIDNVPISPLMNDFSQQ